MKATELKEMVCKTIDDNKERIINLAKKIEQNPELGYKEIKTSQLVRDFFKELDMPYREGLAITGVKAKLKENSSGPNVAVLGELDALVCSDNPIADPMTGAAHACGHHLQVAAMMGAALGLKIGGLAPYLEGNVTFMAVPAEEYIEIAYRSKLREEGKIHFLGGKQELIYLGEFDDIDISMMVHSAKDCPEAAVAVGETSNGFIGKNVQYLGKQAHAADAPEKGVNALNAAMLGLMGIHALRETFRDQDVVRVHPIITKGGDLVNSVPADVRIETYVRAKTMAAIEDTHGKVDRALKAGGDAIGAQTIINTIPGYLPLNCSSALNDLLVKNAKKHISQERVIDAGHFSASTDMGDVSHLMPAIHPFVGGVRGALHANTFKVEDYYTAAVLPAKLMAMTVIDLLCDGADKGKEIIADFKPLYTKEQYISALEKYFI